MQFLIGDCRYQAEHIDRLTLKDLLLLEAETGALGRPMTFATIQMMAKKFEAASLAGQTIDNDDPDLLWFIAFTIWASRRSAGEQVTLAQAIDVPLSAIRWVKDPTDHPPTARRPGPSAGKKKRAHGRGSGQVAARAEATRTRAQPAPMPSS